MKKKFFASKRSRITANMLTYPAVFISMGTVLSLVSVYKMPMGGSVTACSMMFVSLAGWFFGPAIGFTAAVSYGFLQLLFDGYVVHPIQLLLDYPLAFGCFGVSGFFMHSKRGLLVGYLAGVCGRLICSVLSGVVYFSEYAGEAGFDSIWLYSFAYNFTYIAPEAAISAVILTLPVVADALLKLRRDADDTA